MHSFLLLILTFSVVLALSSAQFLYHQPAGLQLSAFHQPQQLHYQATAAVAPPPPPPQAQQYAHQSVVENAARESQLPPELLKSDRFYKHPHIAAALAKESWFTDKEMPVLDREAEKIPREMVYKIFKNAGWIKRR